MNRSRQATPFADTIRELTKPFFLAGQKDKLWKAKVENAEKKLQLLGQHQDGSRKRRGILKHGCGPNTLFSNIRAGRYCPTVSGEGETNIQEIELSSSLEEYDLRKNTDKEGDQETLSLLVTSIQVIQHERNTIYTVGTHIKLFRLMRNRVVTSDQTTCTHQYNADTTLYS